MKFKLGRGIDKSDERTLSSSKKLMLGGGILTALIVVSGGMYLVTRDDVKPSSAVAGTVVVKRDSCKLFTLKDAKTTLGKLAKASSNNANAVSARATVSTCSYNVSSESDQKAITVLVRSSNAVQARQAFEVARAQDAETIKGLAESAYYNPSMAQLNMLQRDNWIIIAATQGNENLSDRASAEKAARIIVGRL